MHTRLFTAQCLHFTELLTADESDADVPNFANVIASHVLEQLEAICHLLTALESVVATCMCNLRQCNCDGIMQKPLQASSATRLLHLSHQAGACGFITV